MSSVITKSSKKKGQETSSYFIPQVTFSSNFLHAVTFLHVLHLDILKRQIEIETEGEN